MTETPNTPATTRPGTELARREAPIQRADTDSWTQVVGSVAALAAKICNTPFVPKGLRGNDAGTAAAMLYGREVGLPPMTSLRSIDVIDGKPAANAEAMRALVLAHGHEYEIPESTGSLCRMRGRRRGSEAWLEVVWSIDMARHAGLLSKDNWRNYPRAMLLARCTTELCRAIFPDVLHGLSSVEEVEDVEGEATPAPEGTKVKRTTSTRRPITKGPRPPSGDAPAAPAGALPLPGEDGYDAGTPTAAAGSGDPAAVVHEAEAQGRPLTAEEIEAVEEYAKCAVDHEDGRRCRREAGHDGRHYYGRDNAPVRGVEDVNLPDEDEERVDDRTETVVEETPGGNGSQPAAPGPAPVVDEAPPPAAAKPAQVRMMQARMSELGIPADDADEQRAVLGAIIGRPLASRRDITGQDAHRILDTLTRVNTHRELLELVDAVETARLERETAETAGEEP